MLDWMAWTWPTAAFFVAIAAILAVFSVLAISLVLVAGVLTIVLGAFVIWFVRNDIAKGFALGRV